MKNAVMLFVLLLGSYSFAIDQRELALGEKCLKKITDAVAKKYGVDDETFSIVATKLLYGGSKGGLHISPVVLVQTSDEVEPRDMIVITSINSDAQAEKYGCKIVSINVQADGTTVDMPGAVEFK